IYPERDLVQSENGFEQDEEPAFTPGTDGALRRWRKQLVEEIVAAGNQMGQTQPGEVISQEPGVESLAVKPEQKENGQQPESRVRDAPERRAEPLHQFESSEAAVIMTPSSRRSAGPGGSELSSEKSMATVSPASADAGTSAVKAWAPGSTYFSVLMVWEPMAAVRL